MSRYDAAFAALRARNRCAFIPFAVAGDPSLAASEAVFKTFADAGADVLEIGYPFSDPIADGPVNQRAAQRAIAAGLNHAGFFKMVAAIRRATPIPMGLLIYANSVYHLGYRTFCRRAVDSGIDSILVADMPPEEAGELLESCKAAGLGTVFIVSELTPEKRIRFICKHTTAFIYVVSRLGTTGVQSALSSSLDATLQRIRRCTQLPRCVGFGLSTPAHVAAVAGVGAEGAIVGSKLVGLIEQHRAGPATMLRILRRTAAQLARAAHGGA